MGSDETDLCASRLAWFTTKSYCDTGKSYSAVVAGLKQTRLDKVLMS